ncbi:uncharacterized protein LOC132602747 [Lycium barbarum]|uniref:uncharacterized protein LOC132602747 n=1 Tax=Lycium barbarum TaxID=112863 RepID=UPI00293F3677|nr:uncharacterized protein LOC132602747 [Lycium barbarum]
MSYNAMLGSLRKMQEVDLVWTKVMLPKQRFIVWLANQERLLTKERLLRLHIPVDDETCWLCEEGILETQQHLFAECSWTMEVRNKLVAWSGVQMQRNGVKQTIKWIKRRSWSQLKKELITGIWGAMIYHIWQARNRKQFRNVSITTSFIVEQIQKEIRHRVEGILGTKRAVRCASLLQRLCN